MIELMVVVLILAVLIAIAVPTYLGARTRAMDRGAQSTARNAFVAVRISYAGSTAYTPDTAAMAAIEPNLEWTATTLTAASAKHAAYLSVSSDLQTVVVGARAANGHCFFIEDVMTSPGIGTRYYGQSTPAPSCTPPATGDSAWTTSW
jgi:type IV pilus assembly protein PilA